jgi:hypothetical protein
MIRRDRRLGLVAGLLSLSMPLMAAGADAVPSIAANTLTIPHSLNLDLDYRARRRSRSTGNFESSAELDLPAGLQPVSWPRNSDMRARLLTPELKGTPLVGWIATNLYRSRRENGWCLEVDPGDGEYVVFYRVHL